MGYKTEGPGTTAIVTGAKNLSGLHQQVTNSSPISNVLGRLKDFRVSGAGYIAPCPGHDDRKWSLSLTEGSDRRALVQCFAGCETADILAKMGLTFTDLFPDNENQWLHATRRNRRQVRRAELPQVPQRYVEPDTVADSIEHGLGRSVFSRWLRDAAGVSLGDQLKWGVGATERGTPTFWYCDHQQRFRTAHAMSYKSNGHRDKDGENRYVYTMAQGYSRCLYGAWQLSEEALAYYHHFEKASPERPIALVESEKTALVLHRHYTQYIWLATGGAGGLTRNTASVLRGRHVCVLFDADEGGRKGAQAAAALVERAGAVATVVELFPDKADGFDLADWFLEKGGVCRK